MQTRRQVTGQILSLSALLATRGRAAWAAEQTLRFASISVAGSPTYDKAVVAYARAIEQDSGGRLEVAEKPSGGYGKPAELLAMLEKGDVELIGSVQGYYPGRFPRSSVMELPLMFDGAIAGSKALTTLFQEGLVAPDYSTVKVLALYVTAPFALFTTGKKINSLRDLRGMRVRVPGATVGLALAKLGAIPLGMPVSMIGDAIANGMVDAVSFSMDSTLGTKGAGGKMVADQLSVVIDLRLAAPAQMVVMNKAKWDSLAPDLQAAIEKAAKDATVGNVEYRETAEEVARKKFQADARYTYVPFSQARHDELRQAMASAYDDWTADMTKRGIDGERLLTRARALVHQYEIASN